MSEIPLQFQFIKDVDEELRKKLVVLTYEQWNARVFPLTSETFSPLYFSFPQIRFEIRKGAILFILLVKYKESLEFWTTNQMKSIG